MISDAEDLERDVINWLAEYTSSGAWFDAARIGLEMGFDRRVSAQKVRGLLQRLVKRGVIECDSNDRPIIYRIKP